MTYGERYWKQLQDFIKAHNISIESFAREAGLAPNTIYNLRKGRSVTLKSLQKITEAQERIRGG
jgi:predicted transcriptional regulator